MKFLDTVNKKLQLLGEQEMGGLNAPQTPGSANPADATAPADQQQQPPLTPEEVDQQGKDEEGNRDADKELCLQVVKNLLEKVKEKIRSSVGGEEGQRLGNILDKLYVQVERREGELNQLLNSVLNTIQNEL